MGRTIPPLSIWKKTRFRVADTLPSRLPDDRSCPRCLSSYAPHCVCRLGLHGAHGFVSVDLEHMERALKRVLQDGRPDAIKVGMLGGPDMASVVFRQLQCYAAAVPVVIDPVLAGGGPSSGSLTLTPAPGSRRRRSSLVDVLGAVLRPGMLITPNAIELGALLGVAPATTTELLREQAETLADEADVSVLAKGGHTDTPGVDVLVTREKTTLLTADAEWQEDLHGTGCALSTAIAAQLAQGAPLVAAVHTAKRYLEVRVVHGTIQVGSGRAQLLAGPT